MRRGVSTLANRRMFSLDIVDSDAFLDMPVSSQNLYFHLGMRADDDGFLNNPKKIAKMVGASDDDLRVLIAKRFVLQFESGIVVIKHWRINNYIRPDRYKPTTYQDEFAKVIIKKNGAYTDGIPMVSKMDTQSSLGKDRDSIELDQSIKRLGIPDATTKKSICDDLTDQQFTFLDQTYEDFKGLIDLIDVRLKASQEVIKNPYAYIVSVAKKERWMTKNG